MNVLVTGGTGFLGRALCRALQQAGHQVVALGSKDADLTRDGSLDRFSSQTFDRIYHLAAWTQAGDFCLTHAGEQWVINQRLNTNVLDWWRLAQPQAKLLCTGTSCTYDPGLPLTEANYMAGQPIASLYSYAMTKRMLYAGLLALNQQYGLHYLHVVPSTLYGPYYHTDGRQMHFIFDLIRKIIRGKKLGEPVILWGDGHQRRELVLVDDFTRTLLQLDRTVVDDTVNVGAGCEYSIREFANQICAIVGYDPHRIAYDDSRYVGATSKCLSVSKLHSLLPGTTMTPLADGLRCTIDWFLDNTDALLR